MIEGKRAEVDDLEGRSQIAGHALGRIICSQACQGG